ncbi:MAG TPA: hypothetical protein VLI67_03745 [Vicinamibacteria bacterium]|nr:hypothetical protein [Vicinamibacteria bacterium]
MRSLRALLVWAGGAAFLAGALAVVAGGDRPAGFPRGSVFNESGEGMSLARRYLRAGVLARPMGPARLPGNAVVFRVRPRGRAERLLTPAEERWVRGGGRLLLAIEDDYGPLKAAPSPRPAPVRKVFPIWPGVRRLVVPDPIRVLAGTPADEAHAVFASGSGSVLSRLPLERGEVVLFAVPEVLENAHLGEADHLRLLVAMAGEGRPVLFDEWAHGHGRDEGLLDLMLEQGFGPFLMTAAVAFALWLWRGRARLGPEDREPAEARSEAVDLVDSLAQLYDRALTRREAARLYREGFQRAVGIRTGLKGAALAARAGELLGRGLPPIADAGEIPPSAFLGVIRAVNDGYRRLHEHAHSRRTL